MDAVIEAAAALVLLAYVIWRSPSAYRDRAARATWWASAVGFLALLCRGALGGADALDRLLGSHNWINLVQNLFVITALWLIVAVIDGTIRNRPARFHLEILIPALLTIVIPFVYVDKGPGTGGRDFVIRTIGQTPMLMYALIYMGWLMGVACALWIQMRRRFTIEYVLLRLGSGGVFMGALLYAIWAVLAYRGVGSEASRAPLYLAFTPLFFFGIIILVIGSATFTAAYRRRLAKARKIRRQLDPTRHAPVAGEELSDLYETVIIQLDSGTRSAEVLAAEKIVSQNPAMQALVFPRKRKAQ